MAFVSGVKLAKQFGRKMAEKYSGVKFKTFLEKNEVRMTPKCRELIKWCSKLSEAGLAPKYVFKGKVCSSGNLSFRTENGFMITSTGSDLSCCSCGQLVEITKCDLEKKAVFAKGACLPSSETLMHFLIYSRRKDVNAVFHAHDDAILRCANSLLIPVTEKEAPYGTIELAEEVLNALGSGNYAAIKNHGIVSAGRTMKEAGNLALKMHQKACAIS